jgi:23S rRNA pseudouridine1911/1915/1917 synthase
VKTSGRHWTVTSEEQGLRLDRFLAAAHRLGSRGRVRAALERGQVFFNDAEASVRDAGVRLASGDTVRIWLDRPGSSRRKAGFEASGLHILYEDETLLVVNKPAGLLAVPLPRGPSTTLRVKPSRSAFRLLADHLGTRARRTPFVVHRIDRDTSGIVVFAKTASAQHAIKDQFARREPERVYWAVVHGIPRPARGTWRDRLTWDAAALRQRVADARDPKGVEAVSDYRVLETFGDASLIEVRLHTGKRNQIRIQAAVRGHALVGERQYADGPSQKTGPTHPRQALHAYRLSFAHPIDGRRLKIEAPLPDDLNDLLRRLRTTVTRRA